MLAALLASGILIGQTAAILERGPDNTMLVAFFEPKVSFRVEMDCPISRLAEDGWIHFVQLKNIDGKVRGYPQECGV